MGTSTYMLTRPYTHTHTYTHTHKEFKFPDRALCASTHVRTRIMHVYTHVYKLTCAHIYTHIFK